MIYKVPHFINGNRIHESNPSYFPIHNPATGEKIGEVGFASQGSCELAISSAKKAFTTWSQTTSVKRAQILFQFRELLEKHQLELVQGVTREHGKTIEDAKGSITRAIELVEFHCGLLSQVQGTVTMNVAHQVDCMTIRQPLGVCFGVSPFNFPIMVPVWMMIPAIAAGNTFILKPSEQDPSVPIRLMELLSEAGLPPGVVNCIQGDKTTVDYFVTHPDLKACTSVASTAVSEAIYKKATAHGKRAHTFGGAKNHCMVMPDANMNDAAKAIVGASYGAAGERCMAISVVIAVGNETAEHLKAKLIPLIQAIKIDAGDAKEVDMGPLISHSHRERVLKLIESGITEGAQLVIDGRNFIHPQYPKGYYLGPCLFDEVTETMSIYQEEIFGPVLVIVRVPDFESALDLINRNPYGNGTAIFTQNGYIAREFSLRVQIGMVGINIPIPVPVASHPFGGWKKSSFGDIGMHGMESLRFYTQSKSITSKWPSTEGIEAGFAMPTHKE